MNYYKLSTFADPPVDVCDLFPDSVGRYTATWVYPWATPAQARKATAARARTKAKLEGRGVRVRETTWVAPLGYPCLRTVERIGEL